MSDANVEEFFVNKFSYYVVTYFQVRIYSSVFIGVEL